MSRSRNQISLFAAVTLLATSNIQAANAGELPCKDSASEQIEFLKKKCSKGIQFSVSGAAGSGTDQVARHISSEFGKYGVVTVVENKPTANGHVAAVDMQTNSNPCKFLLVSHANISLNTFNPNMKPAVDPLKTFRPVSMVYSTPFVLAVSTRKSGDPTIKDLDGFLDLQQKHNLFFASSGPGSASQVLAAALEAENSGLDSAKEPTPEQAINFDTHIPYQGSSPARLAMIKGDQHYFIESPITIKALKDAGGDSIEILGSTSKKKIKVEGISKKTKKLTDVEIEPLSRNPRLKNMVAAPYTGFVASKEADPNYAVNFEVLNRCIVNQPKFREVYEKQGYEMADGTSIAMKTAMERCTTNSFWGRAFQTTQKMESQFNAALAKGLHPLEAPSIPPPVGEAARPPATAHGAPARGQAEPPGAN
jgi:tripartite-type tricarboxylate transporter receptor subunit TctC